MKGGFIEVAMYAVYGASAAASIITAIVVKVKYSHKAKLKEITQSDKIIKMPSNGKNE